MRFNQRLLQLIGSIMTNAQLSPAERDRMWVQALHHAVYLHQRLPAAGQLKTPLEQLFGIKPSVKHLGCGAPLLTSVTRTQLESFNLPARKVCLSGMTTAARLVEITRAAPPPMGSSVQLGEITRVAPPL